MVIIEMILLPMIFLQIGLGESCGYVGKNERFGRDGEGQHGIPQKTPCSGKRWSQLGKCCRTRNSPKGLGPPSPTRGSSRNHFTSKCLSYLIRKIGRGISGVGWLEVIHVSISSTVSDTWHALSK